MSESSSSSAAVTASASAAPSGKLAVLTAYAIAASTIPIPFVPARLIRRVRGAIVHDVGLRHGISFTSDARDVLAAPSASERGKVLQAAEALARQLVRRFAGPLGFFGSATAGVEVYALGLLLERYVRDKRPHGSVRMHVDEARTLRDAIDKSLLRAASPSLKPALATLPAGVDDLRDEFTRWVDALLLTTATLPSYAERRLESAFDEIARETQGFGRA